jgi:potassium efflux system protein
VSVVSSRVVRSSVLLRVLLLVALHAVATAPARAQDAGQPQDQDQPPLPVDDQLPLPLAGEGRGEGTTTPADVEADSASEAESDVEVAIEELAQPRLHARDISAAVARTRSAVQTVRAALRPRRAIERITRDLPHFSEDVARLEASRSPAQVARMSQRELADARHQWHEYEDQLDEWHTTLTERQEALDTINDELRDLRRVWHDIDERAAEAELPEAMRERAPTSLAMLHEYDDELDVEIARTRDLEDRVSELLLGVADVTDQIEQATRGFQDRLLIRDSPPLWRGISRGGDEQTYAEQARASWLDRVGSATVLLGRSQAPAAVGLVSLLVVLASLLTALSRRSHTWAEDDDTFARARAIVRTPLSTAAVLTLSIAPFVVLNAPMLFYDLVLVVLLVPLLRVLPPLLPKSVRSLLFTVAVFLLVVRVETMTIEGTGLRRLVLTIECVPAIVTLGRWLSVERRASTTPVWLLAVVSLAFVIATSAMAADVLGWVFLSAMLMRGVVASAYAAFALFAGIVVVETLLAGALKSGAMGKLRAVRDHGELVRRRSVTILVVSAAFLWGEATLEGFGMTRTFTDWADEVLGRSWVVGSAAFSIGSVLLFFVILFVTWGVARFVRFVLEMDVLPRLKLEPGVDGAISTLTRYVILSLGLLLGLASVGVDQSQIALVAGALGVGVGFGLQSIVSNCISGIILMLERPVRLDDFIEVGPLVGRVERIGLRSSTVRALDGAEVIVPNDSLISREVVNWTLSDRRRRVRVKVGVAYGTDLTLVREVMKTVADAHAAAIGGPPPEVLFDSFGESSLDFVLEFWTTDFAEWEHLRSAVGIDLYDALTKAGIEIPFPQRDVHVRTLPEPKPPKA